MSQPLISIALCTYNGEKYLAEQLESIINQTYKNIEIIAVDDCSSDGTLLILQEYAQQYPQIKVFSNTQIKDTPKTLNMPFLFAKGNTLLFRTKMIFG